KYEGELKNDRFEGNGTMTWSDGSKYVGEWKDDQRHGEGTMTWSDGTKYVGEWKNDEREGKGILTFANGDKYEGEFKDDEMHGKGAFTHAEGKKYTGDFDEGKFSDGAKPRTPDKIIDRVVAVVNDSVLTLSEVKEAAQTIQQDPEDPEVQSEVLDLLIEETLLEQEAKKRGIRVTEEEVDASIADIKRRFNLDDEKLNEVLKKQNLTPQAFRDQWKRQLLSRKLVGTQVQGQIAVTEDEIKNYYEKNYGKLQFTDEIRISHILITVDTSEEESQKLSLEVAQMAQSGKDFGKLAEEYSKDEASANRGGDLGYFKKGELVEALENAIKNAPTGEVIGPVRSPYGYHIIKVTDRKMSEETALDNNRREEVREELYKQKVEKAIQTWLENVKETAYIENKL
ncbi:MAG TPA: peptidylprolyl isomerase, partial [Thermodesulfobacteriota bacterium]|nr:peptidylprolyl isomerase [Thermodesulfobacteriota bacterium]